MITFEKRFSTIVQESRAYLQIVSKLEDAFDGLLLDNMYVYPQHILNLLEEESQVNWSDEIWESIYNDTPCSEILEMIKQLKEIKENY